MQKVEHRRPQFFGADQRQLKGSDRKAAIECSREELRGQIDMYTSKQGLEHRNIRFVRELNVRTKVDSNGSGYNRINYIHNYHAIIMIGGKYYIGTIDYGAHRSRKQACSIAFERALMSAVCGEEVTETSVDDLRFSREKVTSGS